MAASQRQAARDYLAIRTLLERVQHAHVRTCCKLTSYAHSVDDRPATATLNPRNLVPIHPFSADQLHDEELRRLAAYLVTIADAPDVRALALHEWRLQPSP